MERPCRGWKLPNEGLRTKLVDRCSSQAPAIWAILVEVPHMGVKKSPQMPQPVASTGPEPAVHCTPCKFLTHRITSEQNGCCSKPLSFGGLCNNIQSPLGPGLHRRLFLTALQAGDTLNTHEQIPSPLKYLGFFTSHTLACSWLLTIDFGDGSKYVLFNAVVTSHRRLFN